MQKDLSAVAEFAKRFATEAACRDYLIQLRWPEGFRCSHCGGRENWRLKNARFECRACGRQTSATAGTVFEGTRKPLRLWFRAMECVTSRRQGASARALQGLLRLPSYQTAWVWLHKLRRRHGSRRSVARCRRSGYGRVVEFRGMNQVLQKGARKGSQTTMTNVW